MAGDYDQVEMRLFAHVAGVTRMIDTFIRGEDIHAINASRMFRIDISSVDDQKHRYPAKRVGFGTIYDIGPQGLLAQMIQEEAGDWGYDDCKMFLQLFDKEYPEIPQYKMAQRTAVRRTGEVRDIFGRRRLIPEIYSSLKYVREGGERQAINSPIQMGAQGIIKKAMGSIHPLIEDEVGVWAHVRVLLQIHDELFFEVEEEAEMEAAVAIRDAMMEAGKGLTVPIIASMKSGANWADLKKIKIAA